MLQFEGVSLIPAPVETVRARLTDPAFLVRCVPDVAEVHRVEKDRAAFSLRPGFTFVRGSLEMELEIRQEGTDGPIIHLMKSKGIGATSEVETRITLQPEGTQTSLSWSAEVKKLTGLLKAVPQGLLKGAAQKIVTDAVAALQKELSNPTTL